MSTVCRTTSAVHYFKHCRASCATSCEPQAPRLSAKKATVERVRCWSEDAKRIVPDIARSTLAFTSQRRTRFRTSTTCRGLSRRLDREGTAVNVGGSKAVGEPPLLTAISVWCAVKHALRFRLERQSPEAAAPGHERGDS